MTDCFRTPPDWEDIRFFIALARHGSLSATARALAVNHATVARRIASLETSLREKLVERRPDGYVLTGAGQRALAAAAGMEIAAAGLGRVKDEDSPHGLVRLSATPGLTQGFLAARLPRLTQAHPGLDIELATEVRSVSLDRHEADLALRIGSPRDGAVLARPLVTMGFAWYASQQWATYLANGGTPAFVGFDEANAHLPEARWLTRHAPQGRLALRTSNQFAQATAVVAGAGVALLPHFIGRPLGLVVCTPAPVPTPRDLYLVLRRESLQHLPTRTVIDFLEGLFANEQALFAG